jgi:hypothetical protein
MNNFFLCLVLVLFFCSKNNFGQEINHDTTSLRQFKNEIFIEILGANGYLSINYQRSLLKNHLIELKSGLGFGYFSSKYTPTIYSLTLRVDLSYNLMKNIKPIIGVSYSDVVEKGNNGDIDIGYYSLGPNAGLDFMFFKRVHLLPKYYYLLTKRLDYERWDHFHYGGLQLKYCF